MLRRTLVGGLRVRLAWLCIAVLAALAVLRWGGAYSPVPAWSVRDAAARYSPGQLVEARRWLSAGAVPGATTRWRDMSEQALLDLRSLTWSNGVTVASDYGPWRHVWPRDASWVAAAFCVTGHRDEAARVLGFLGRVQRADGGWAARYRLDGKPLRDGRRSQLDATGWVPWAVSVCAGADPGSPFAARFWPTVRAAAYAATAALGTDGLPRKSPDYWETRSEVTLGTAAAVLLGLRSAVNLARQLRQPVEAHQWTAAADQLSVRIDAAFGAWGYQRRPGPGSGADAAVTFLAPPFGPRTVRVSGAVRQAAARLAVPNGGIRPGEEWHGDPHEAWTPETAFFALAYAASGEHTEAARLLDWLDEHRTKTGSLPERVSKFDDPVSVAPLGWTAAITLLALTAYDGTLS